MLPPAVYFLFLDVNAGRTAYVEIKRTSSPGKAEEPKAELADPCQSLAKIERDDRERRVSYEPTILRTNVSFLWSDRTRNFLDSKNERQQARLSSSLVEKDEGTPEGTAEETFEETCEEPYDDVGPPPPPLSESFSQVTRCIFICLFFFSSFRSPPPNDHRRSCSLTKSLYSLGRRLRRRGTTSRVLRKEYSWRWQMREGRRHVRRRYGAISK